MLPRRRAFLLALAGAATLLLALAPIASASWIAPQTGGSPNANDINTLYKIVFYIGLAIFFLVEGLLVYAVVRFRRRRGGPEPAMVHGNTPLEVGWTVGAALIVAVIAAITFIYLPRIKDPPNSSPGGLQQLAGVELADLTQPKPPNGKALHINVVGQQYIWRFDYVDAKRLTENRPVFAYYEMVVPTNTTVVLQVNSSDVAHSWWIPELGGKFDAIPGHNNYTWFKISKPGVYKGQCAELCGNNHADMLAEVRAVPPDQFTSWLNTQRQEILQSQQLLAQQRRQGEGR